MKVGDVFLGRNLKSIDSAEFRATLTAYIVIPRFQWSRMLMLADKNETGVSIPLTCISDSS